MKRELWLACVCLLCVSFIRPVVAQEAGGIDEEKLLAPYRAAAMDRWDRDVRALEALDRTEEDPEDAVLLIGSSSIRLWDTAAEDLAPYPVIRRGYGGAKFTDEAVFARRLIEPHRFRAMVLFVANDVTGGANDTPPAKVEQLVRHIVAVAREREPEAQLFIVEVTPTRSRFGAWDKIRKVNEVLREIALTEVNTHFVPTAEYYLDAAGQPREELFRDDQLHQNREGYVLWGKLIRRRLDDFLGGPVSNDGPVRQ